MRISGTSSICAVVLYALTLGYQARAIELDINNEREYHDGRIDHTLIPFIQYFFESPS